jgi:hypothetical protein
MYSAAGKGSTKNATGYYLYCVLSRATGRDGGRFASPCPSASITPANPPSLCQPNLTWWLSIGH